LLATLLWAAALAYFSLAPDVAAPAGINLWDKFSHFAAYAVLAVLLVLVLVSRGPLALRGLAGAWFGCAGYGLLLEGLQWGMALGRQFELGDLLANGLGALCGCAVFCRKVRR
jgi:VanZ family protein